MSDDCRGRARPSADYLDRRKERCGAAGLAAGSGCVRPGATPIPVAAGGSALGWLPEWEPREETRVPYVDSGEARIWYTEQGTGFPMLTLAPGGMRSGVSLWEVAAINPLTAYAGQYKMIAMDQRNAGQSAGPLEAGDPWGAYAADQLAVMDHLGIDRFLVFGCCIGGPFILKLCELAPERVVAAVLEQPVGIIESNRELFDSI